MRTRLLLFACALLTVWAVAQVMPSSRRIATPTPVVVVAGGCATTDTDYLHNTMLEGWEGDTTNTWTLSGTVAGITITTNADSSALTTGKPTGACNTAFKCAVVAESTTASSYYRDLGSAIATNVTHDVTFAFYLETAPDASEAFRILTVNNGTASTASLQYYVSLQSSATGQPELVATGSSGTSILGTNGEVYAGQWIKVRIHSDLTEPSSFMQFNDGTTNTFTRFLNPARYMHAGATGGLAIGESGTYWMDIHSWDTP